MKNILVLGGTRFVGLELINILIKENVNLYVASRNEIPIKNFIKIDRKSQNDLDLLFKSYQFDVVIDFINFSYPDSIKLFKALRYQRNPPRLILISTTYVYDQPLQLVKDSVFDENSFLPNEHQLLYDDRPDISYSNGKRDMECFFLSNYFSLTILRFPIILGANDYTQRTIFYSSLIKEGKSINPRNVHSKSNYIFSIEAAQSLFYFINEDLSGVFNVCFSPISEYDLISVVCKYHNCKISYLISEEITETNTPFTSLYDFKVDNSKFQKLFSFESSFESCLIRELLKLNF